MESDKNGSEGGEDEQDEMEEGGQGLPEEFAYISAEGLSADGNYSVFKLDDTFCVYNILNSCIEAKIELEQV